ncbi:MAG: hypothetical protein CMQ75_03345 [Gammaproteobacteria bacterium]|nr:hypothetical protein [Gammaproteobacteria bacterium]
MSTSNKKGAIFFAYNNEQLDYVKLACLSATSVKKHLNLSCMMITDSGSLAYSDANLYSSGIFDDVKVYEKTDSTENIRNYYDTPYARYKAQFNNLNKHEVFDLSPYDQTILFDVDYLVNNNILNLAFNIASPIQLYKNAHTLKNAEPDHIFDKRLNDVSIPLYWSTVIYFNKSVESKLFFNMWAHVKENYEYYQSLYKFPEGLYRTDFAVSISMHLLKSFYDCVDDVFAELPGTPMKYMAYKDDIDSVTKDGIIFFANDQKEEWKNILTYSEGENLHMMNKRAIERHYDELMELYV